MRTSLAGVPANQMTPGQREKALKTLELYLNGKKWREMAALGAFNWTDFTKLMALYPDLSRAFKEARSNSGYWLEERALDLADELVAKHEFTGTQIKAHEVALKAYQWSASRRSEDFADRNTAKTGATIPIQINTTLNLEVGLDPNRAKETVWDVAARIKDQGAGFGPEAEASEDIVDLLEDNGYSIAFDLKPEAEATEPPPEVEGQEGVQTPTEVPKAPEAGAVASGEALAAQLGLPAVVPKAIVQRKSPGRRPKGHMSPTAARLKAGKRAKMKMSPSVRRALGLPLEDEPKDEQPTEPIGVGTTGDGK